MGVDRRRAGFRLPWSADGEDTGEAQAAVSDAAGDTATAEAETPTAEPMTPPESQAAAETTAATETATADETTPEPMTATETMSEDAMTASSPANGTGATPADGESDDFLKSLVGAMRGVAETSRDSSLAELRTAIEARIEALRSAAAERETDIRRQADTDLEGVGDWERSEIDRVKGEAETKRTDRRSRLEQELAAHRTASEQAVDATSSRLAQHENELAAFFSQLGEITDPAAFVAAAKRMPRAPELEGEAANAAGAAATTDSTDPRLAALGVSPPAETAQADEPSAESEGASEAAVEATALEATSEAAADEAGDTNGTVPPADAQLAERLAQLDERLSGAQPPAAATAAPAPPAAAAGTETSTAIVVKGLGSFGAITSFKQALERVEGIRGVTLSLGPTGEFVYRASHTGEFDLAAAIQTLEGPTASIENTDGTLVVTLSRAR